MPSRRRNVGKGGDYVTRAELRDLEQRLETLNRSLPIWMERQPLAVADPTIDDSYQFRFTGVAERAEFAEVITDGDAPASSPTPTVQGGPRYLTIKYPVTSNADLVTYEIHVGTTAAFTTSATTLAAETPANLIYIRAVNGVDLAYDTDYYVKIIAKDTDGAAAVGTEVGPTQLDPNGSDDILTGSVTAEHLSSVMALISALVAGNLGAERLEVGFGTDVNGDLDPGFIGIRSYEADGTTVTFRVNALTGDVYIKGRVDFGTGSRLMDNDKIEFQQQPTGTYQEANLVQVNGKSSGSVAGATATCTWDSPTVAGNECLLFLTIRDPDAIAPTPTTPANYALVESRINSGLALFIYRLTSVGSQSGAVTITLNDTGLNWTLMVQEWSGVQIAVADETSDQTGNSASPDSGTTGTTSQTDELWLASFAWIDVQSGVLPGSFISSSSPTNGFTDENLNMGDDYYVGAGRWSHTHSGSTYVKKVTATGTANCGVTLTASANWVGIVLCLQNKLAAVDPPETDKVVIYAKDDTSGHSRAAAMGDDGIESILGGPPGIIHAYGGSSAPIGYLLCDGSAVSRTTYDALFDVVGTTFGTGDGSTTFNLPNLKGKIPVGIDVAQVEFDTRGSGGGTKTHTLTISEMPSHDHPGGRFLNFDDTSGSTAFAGGGTRAFTKPVAQGGGAAHQNLQPYIAMHYIIKT